MHIIDLDRSSGRVSFYNPMFNEVQEMTWAEFSGAWAATNEAGITNYDYILVAAHPGLAFASPLRSSHNLLIIFVPWREEIIDE